MSNPRAMLKDIARRAMIDRGFAPEYSPAATAQIRQLSDKGDPASGDGSSDSAQGRRDLRHLPWCSIDNEDSRDLDQLSVAEVRGGGDTAILVAIADVDALVPCDSPIDRHASLNTTSVYTAAEVFPMLPDRLSTDLTSLNDGEDRPAVVVDMTIADDGDTRVADVYLAVVHNRARLAYPSVGAWLQGEAPAPLPLQAVDGLEDNLRRQDAASRALKALRHRRGALTLDTTEGRPVFDGDTVRDVVAQHRTRAAELIEDFMIASNASIAEFLESCGFSSLRRVVRMPERWPRIIALAAETGTDLPPTPDSR